MAATAAATTKTTTRAPPGDDNLVFHSYTFRPMDYAVVIGVLVATALIGLYHVWRSKRAKNTREFLVADTRIGLGPLVLSMTATALTPSSMLGLPMESYSNGVQLIMGNWGWVLSKLFSVYTIVPVLYRLNVSTLNQYIEYRYNKWLRTVPAFVGLLQLSLVVAAITYITAVVLSKATGLQVWWSILLIMVICIIYSSLGGVSAVIWTDVIQILIVFIAIASVIVVGVIDAGGFSEVWRKNARGQRTTFAYLKPDKYSHYTIWSLICGNFFMGLGFAATNQSELQRQLANRTLNKARMMSVFTSLTLTLTTVSVVFIGNLIYARYGKCDPLLAGEVTSRDELAAVYTMELFENVPGMFGLYVAAILCATLSTLSSVINAFATITLIDFVKPFIPRASDATSRLISKSIGILYGLTIMSLTGVTHYFGGLTQTMQAISGTSVGPTGGIFVLGIFFPWATTKGATIGYVVSICLGWWLSIGRITAGAPYTTAPLSTSGCNLTSFSDNVDYDNFTTSAFLHMDMAPSVSPERDGTNFMYLIAPIWYGFITIWTAIILGLIASFATGSEDLRKLDPRLISPLTKAIARSLPESIQKKTGLAALLANDKKVSAIQEQDMKRATTTELQTLNAKCEQVNGNTVIDNGNGNGNCDH